MRPESFAPGLTRDQASDQARRRPPRWVPTPTLPVIWVLLAWPVPALAAQTVVGTVVDGASEEPVPGATVALITSEGAVERRAETDAAGRLLLPARRAGAYFLEVTRIGFAPMRTDSLALRDQTVEVEIRIFRSPIELGTFTVVGRRRDARHNATLEGALVRHELFPQVGTRRVVLRGGAEFRSAMVATDILQQFDPARGCIIVYANGWIVRYPEEVEEWLQKDPTESFEALEYYRYWSDAPLDLKDAPPYVDSPADCSVVALWPRADPPPRRTFTRGMLVGAAGMVTVVLLIRTALQGL
jgi:hypothetical protein